MRSKKSKRLFTLISYLCEEAYRRGYQHGVKYAVDGYATPSAASRFRFNKAKSISPPHNPQGYKCRPEERLSMEMNGMTAGLTFRQGEEFQKIMDSI